MKHAVNMNRAICWLVLIFLAFVCLAPFYLTIVNSFKNRIEITKDPLGPPDSWNPANYIKAWKATQLGTALLNSFVVSALSVVFIVITSSPLAYVLSKSPQSRAISALSGYLLICSTVPLQLFIIPLFFIFKKLGLTDNLTALSLIYCVIFTPFASFLLRTYFKEIDPAIHEAAAIDGAGTLQIFTRILLPLVFPGLLTVAIIIFLWTWNDFLMAVTFLRDPDKLTVGIRFFAFQGRFSTNVGRQMAFAVMIMTPILVFFIAFQRKFIEGMTAGGVKG